MLIVTELRRSLLDQTRFLEESSGVMDGSMAPEKPPGSLPSDAIVKDLRRGFTLY
jgi:hypothetical protein